MIKDLLIENIPVNKKILIELLTELGDIDSWTNQGLIYCIETHNKNNKDTIKLYYDRDDGYKWITPYNSDEAYSLELIQIDYKDIYYYINTKEIPKNNFKNYGFTADFSGEILKEVDGYYIGWADVPGYGIQSCKWSKDGTSKYECYRLTPEWFKTDKHWIMTKEGSPDSKCKRKFKIAWTEEMKDILKETGWRFATEEERNHLRLED